MASRRLLLFFVVLGVVTMALGQIGRAQSPTYGVGRAPTAEEIRAWDIAISPTGKELPAGHGVGEVTQVTAPAELMHSCVLGPKPPAADGEA